MNDDNGPPQRTRKRRAVPPMVGQKKFDCLREAMFYLRCGSHPSQASPCVVRENLDPTYPLVYEKWQRVQSSDKNVLQWFRCRRRGTFRRKKGLRHVSEGGQRRRANATRTEYTHCGCLARFSMRTDIATGQVTLTFRGHHNHDCQREYAANFLNPIQECFHIREIVDTKLFAGIFNVHKILAAVLSTSFAQRDDKHTTFEQLRTYQMVIALKRQQIRNRIMQLGLNPDRLTHKFVTRWIILNTLL